MKLKCENYEFSHIGPEFFSLILDWKKCRNLLLE